MKYTLKTIWKKVKIYVGFPQSWLFLIILFLTSIVLFFSINEKDAYWQSLFSNIFAGLITGLVLSLLSGTRQIYIAIQERKLNWLKEIHSLIMDYFELHHKFLSDDYAEQNREEFVYDMGAHVNWVKEHVLQSSFDRRLPFDSVKYCKRHYGFDAMVFSEKSRKVHDILSNGNSLNKKEVIELFKDVDKELRTLNSKVCNDMRDLEIKIATAQRSIV